MTHKIHLTEIVIKENRQRQEFDPQALQELKNSIQDNQLLHPIVLRLENHRWVLVSGERRLRAITEIFFMGGQFIYNGDVFKADDELIPFTNLGELTYLEAEEAELDENLKRRDLTWQEHAAAVAKLHNLRQAQANELSLKLAVEGDYSAELVQHTIADTAEELTGRRDGMYQDNIRKEIIVSQHLNNPVIAKAKNADEAFKLLKRDEEQKKNVALAASVGASFSADKHTLLNIDCLEFMMQDSNQGQFDVILTDPPYGMGADSFGDGGGKLDGIEHHYDDSYESWQRLLKVWASLSFGIAKPQAHAYVFCDFDRFHELKAFMQAAGWYVFRTPLIVYKVNSGRVPLPDQGPRRQYEIILYAIKGKKPVTHIYPDVITSQADENMSHGAQKPVNLYQNLLSRSVRPGDRVIDTFAGTGPIFPAAQSFLCEATGLEMNPEYYALSMKRLQDLKQADEMLVIE
jgi:site-specific DNA-methyltransferase (adenine-specific)